MLFTRIHILRSLRCILLGYIDLLQCPLREATLFKVIVNLPLRSFSVYNAFYLPESPMLGLTKRLLSIGSPTKLDLQCTRFRQTLKPEGDELMTRNKFTSDVVGGDAPHEQHYW